MALIGRMLIWALGMGANLDPDRPSKKRREVRGADWLLCKGMGSNLAMFVPAIKNVVNLGAFISPATKRS